VLLPNSNDHNDEGFSGNLTLMAVATPTNEKTSSTVLFGAMEGVNA
jgi:hypothetical protein